MLAARFQSWCVRHGRVLRPVVSLAASLAIHGAVVAGLGWVDWSVGAPRLEITWLDLDNVLGAPVAPMPPQLAAKRSSQASSQALAGASSGKANPRVAAQHLHAAARRQSRVQSRLNRQQRRALAEPARLADLAPGQAALILLLRCDRIRRSPYAADVRSLLAVFYDYRALLWTGDIDPVRDFQALMIATPNPYRVTRTFLAARHRLEPATVRRAIDTAVRANGGQMHWSREDADWLGEVPSPPLLEHDPRILLLRDHLLLMLDPQLRPELIGTGEQAGAEVASPDDVGQQPLIARLQGIDAQGGQSAEKGPGLLLEVENLRRLVRLPADIPPPKTIIASIPATAPAPLRGALTFASRSQATAFMRAVRGRIDQAQRSLLLELFGFTDILQRLRLRQRGSRVDVRVVLRSSEVHEALGVLRGMIPQVSLPGGRPAQLRNRRPLGPKMDAVQR